ncbi:abscisic acid 8'-hydroxylase 1-like [Canna indica]|uniref:Abscisic acid 8'-hydroxylase 1-like n=1 Tax=Canna indica TaxID=4628 RepID=A0AAQ3K791_9LILI|nr:abscisic acid 8'-hydroxylase 1-like [Canna indica]
MLTCISQQNEDLHASPRVVGVVLSCALPHLPSSSLQSFPHQSRELPLPPRSLGWSYTGETLHLYSKNPNAFFALKQQRYGAIFKTHILGCPCVMVSSPEAASGPSRRARSGCWAGRPFFFQQGEYHAWLRRLMLRLDAIHGSVTGIEAVVLYALRSWDGCSVNTFQEMKMYAFNVALLSIFGKDEISYIEDLKQCYYTPEKGYNSMPINLPGTLFYKAMKARKQLAKIVAKIVSSRRTTQLKAEPNDLLASFMESKEALIDDQIADNCIGVIFVARDSTTGILTWKLSADVADVVAVGTLPRLHSELRGVVVAFGVLAGTSIDDDVVRVVDAAVDIKELGEDRGWRRRRCETLLGGRDKGRLSVGEWKKNGEMEHQHVYALNK